MQIALIQKNDAPFPVLVQKIKRMVRSPSAGWGVTWHSGTATGELLRRPCGSIHAFNKLAVTQPLR
jgi:hypothetical protein